MRNQNAEPEALSQSRSPVEDPQAFGRASKQKAMGMRLAVPACRLESSFLLRF